jgi:tetratricopeptide (TPR) repeat protein
MTNSSQGEELVQRGIAAAKAGRKDEAQRLLTQAVELDERNERAWLWLSGVVTTFEDRQICLENVLALNPNNAHAQAGLEWLRQNAPPSPPATPPPAAPPPTEAAWNAPEPEPEAAPTVQTARQLVEAGAAQEAIEQLTQIVREQPMNAEAYLLLGDAYRQVGQRAQARQQYDSARRLTSDTSGLGQEARHKLAEMERVPLGEQPHVRAEAARAGRPGCVTVYALLAALGGVMGVLGACALIALAGSTLAEMEQTFAAQGVALPLTPEQLTTLIWASVGLGLVGSALNLAIAVGLWLMKNWARIIVIVLQVLSLLGGVAQAAAAILSTREALAAVGIPSVPVCYLGGFLVGFIIQVYIIFWFVVNRDLFA